MPLKYKKILINGFLAKLLGLSHLISGLYVADSFTNFLVLVDIKAFSRWFFLASPFFYTPGVFVLRITTFCQQIMLVLAAKTIAEDHKVVIKR